VGFHILEVIIISSYRGRESVVPTAINLGHAHKLKLPSLVHGGGWQELESLLNFGRLGVEEREKVGGCREDW